MAKRKKESEYKQTDILSAYKGKDDVIDIQIDPVETKKKAISLFDFVADIRNYKKCDLLDDEDNQSSWNSFMILQALSMKESDVPICNYFNKYIGVMTKKQLYKALVVSIPYDRTFYKWINPRKEELSELCSSIAKYYECSLKEAAQYIEVVGQEFANEINSKFGGAIERMKGK